MACHLAADHAPQLSSASFPILRFAETKGSATDTNYWAGRLVGGSSRLIFQMKHQGVVRIITGWPL